MQIKNESILVKIDGDEIEGLLDHILSLEIDKKMESADTFNLKLGISRCDEESDWSFIDDERFQLFKTVEIELGFDEELEPVFKGYITSINPIFNSDPSKCSLELSGIDETFVLDREQKRRAWDNKTDSDIATEIFSDPIYTNISAYEVETTNEINDDEEITVVQMDTDMKFLQKLARRNGFEAYIENGTAYFKSPDYESASQPVLAAHFGKDTTLTNFNPSVDASAPTNVGVVMVGRTDRELYTCDIESSDIPVYGSNSIDSLRGNTIPAAKTFIGANTLATNAAAESLGQAIYDRQQWFMTASGLVDGNLYGHILHIRESVTIKGVGENYSGEYFVTGVKHLLGSSGYTMDIHLKRNAMQATGDEDFQASAVGVFGF